MTNSARIVILFFIVISIVISCNRAIDIEAEKEKIQARIDLIDAAHFAKSAEQFYKPNANSFYDVRGGNFQKVNKADLLEATQSYFDQMEFDELRRTREPIIEISEDGTMASYIGAVVVKGRLNKVPIFWVVSWQSVLKKIDEEWKIISTANTEAPSKATAGAILKSSKEAIGEMADSGSVYALADCTGPIGDFKTLLLSRRTDGRMEQITNTGHVVFKHGDSISWGKNLYSGRVQDKLDTLSKLFVTGHEFHWLSSRPEDRFKKPIFKEFTEFKGQMAFKIEFKDALDRAVYFYYAFEDYMPLGFENPTDTEENKVLIYFSDWKELNNIKVFEKVVIEEGKDIWQYHFTDIRINDLRTEDFENQNKTITN